MLSFFCNDGNILHCEKKATSDSPHSLSARRFVHLAKFLGGVTSQHRVERVCERLASSEPMLPPRGFAPGARGSSAPAASRRESNVDVRDGSRSDPSPRQQQIRCQGKRSKNKNIIKQNQREFVVVVAGAANPPRIPDQETPSIVRCALFSPV